MKDSDTKQQIQCVHMYWKTGFGPKLAQGGSNPEMYPDGHLNVVLHDYERAVSCVRIVKVWMFKIASNTYFHIKRIIRLIKMDKYLPIFFPTFRISIIIVRNLSIWLEIQFNRNSFHENKFSRNSKSRFKCNKFAWKCVQTRPNPSKMRLKMRPKC